MNEFLIDLAEILEEDVIREEDNLQDFEEWDSLTLLSIIAFSDENFNVTLSTAEIIKSETVGGLKELIKGRM